MKLFPEKILKAIAVSTIIALLLFSISCKKNLQQPGGWVVGVLTPIFQTNLNISNLVGDSLIQVNGDSSLNLVYQTSLYKFDLTKNALTIPDTAITGNFTLDSLKLSDKQLAYPISLGQMCSQLGLIGQVIILNNGNSMPIAAINNISSGDNPIDATQFFQTATLQSGFLDIKLNNGLPIDISNIVFQFRNQMSGTVIAQDTFTNIVSGDSAMKSIDLAGKNVEGQLVAKIIDMDSPGSNGTNVLIDTTDALLATLTLHNVTVQSATAIFPSQNLIDQDNEVKYILDGGAKLKTLKVQSGNLILTVRSTIDDTTRFSFQLPTAISSLGNTIDLNASLPPALGTNVSSYSETVNLAGYTLDLTGTNGNDYNVFLSHLKASIDSTGIVKTLSLNDSVFIDYRFENIVPSYINGYLGQHIEEIGPANSPFSLFNHIQSGLLDLSQVDVDVDVTNGMGAEGRVMIYNLSSVNHRTQQTVSLSNAALINNPVFIQRATDFPYTPSVTNFHLDNSNSNIKNLIENLPDEVNYQLDVFVNPNGNTSNYNDFAYNNGTMAVDLNLNVPLSLMADQLTLVDTMDVSIPQNVPGKPTILDGVFNLIADNGFPLDASVQVYMMNDQFQLIDSLFTQNQIMSAANLDVNCKVSSALQSVMSVPVDENKMEKIKPASHAIVKVSFSTSHLPPCSGAHLNIYSNYNLGLKLTAKFNYYTGD